MYAIRSYYEFGEISGGEPTTRIDPDGDWQRKDVHGGEFHLPADQVRRGSYNFV